MKREGERNTVFTRRALVMMAAQTAALSVLGVKLYRVQVEQGARYATLAESNRISARLIAPTRGRILDRFGQVAAGNTLNWRALLLAEETTDVAGTLAVFGRIVPLADHDMARIDRELKHRRHFIPVMVRDFLSWDDMAKIEVNAPDLPGIVVDVGTTRHYPFGPDMAHIVGYVAPPARMIPATIRCWHCPACASAAPAWRKSTTMICAAMPARCRWKSTPSAA